MQFTSRCNCFCFSLILGSAFNHWMWELFLIYVFHTCYASVLDVAFLGFFTPSSVDGTATDVVNICYHTVSRYLFNWWTRRWRPHENVNWKKKKREIKGWCNLLIFCNASYFGGGVPWMDSIFYLRTTRHFQFVKLTCRAPSKGFTIS